MSKELKLLHALCEALGFDVKTTLDYQPEVIRTHDELCLINRVGGDREAKAESNGRFYIDEDGYRVSVLRVPITEYTLTKRNE